MKLRPYLWMSYGPKLRHAIAHPRFTSPTSGGAGFRRVIGMQGVPSQGNYINLIWWVDESDGVITDLHYKMVGPSFCIGALEAACGLMMRKNYEQARRITPDLIDRELRDHPHTIALPAEAQGYVEHIIGAIHEAADQCRDIPLLDTVLNTPLPSQLPQGEGMTQWLELSTGDKLRLIEQIIQADIRPYIELDAGGVDIVNLSEDHVLTIAYRGNCTSCHAATGSTLSAIQQILKAKASPLIRVVPDPSVLYN